MVTTRYNFMIFRSLSQLSRDWKGEVVVLKELVRQAWNNCTIDYVQLRVAGMARKDERYDDFLKNTVRDLASFKKFTSDLELPTFRNRYVWSAWHYIRPLVMKYIPDWQHDGDFLRLDKRKEESVLQFWLCGIIAGFDQAQTGDLRPNPSISEDDWNHFPPDPLDMTITHAVRFCGYERASSERWQYSEVFGLNSQNFISTVVS